MTVPPTNNQAWLPHCWLAMVLPLVILVVAPGRPARAQPRSGSTAPAPAPANEDARRLFAQGQQAFDERNFDSAAAFFLESYDAVREPLMLFNIASAYDRGGNRRQAVTYYEAYLAATPTAANRPHVESRLTILRAELARTNSQVGDTHAAEPIEEADRHSDAASETGASGPGIAPWLLTAAGAASLVAGGVFTALTLTEKSELDDRCNDKLCPPGQGEAIDRMETFALIADITLGAGAAMLAGGILWLLLADGDEQAPPPITAFCTGTSCNLVALWPL